MSTNGNNGSVDENMNLEIDDKSLPAVSDTRPESPINDVVTSNGKPKKYTTTNYCDNICNSLLHMMGCYMCKKESSSPSNRYNDNMHDIESPEHMQEMIEPPPIPRHVYCGDHHTDTDDEQYHNDMTPYRHPVDILKSYRPSMDMNNISDTHRKTTRQFAIRKKKKLTDVFKF